MEPYRFFSFESDVARIIQLEHSKECVICGGETKDVSEHIGLDVSACNQCMNAECETYVALWPETNHVRVEAYAPSNKFVQFLEEEHPVFEYTMN